MAINLTKGQSIVLSKSEYDLSRLTMALGWDVSKAKTDKIVLGVNIYDAKERKQHFGMVNNAFVRAVDATGKEIARYRLSNDPSYEGKLNREVYREGGDWKFKALGNPFAEDMNGVVGSFMR